MYCESIYLFIPPSNSQVCDGRGSIFVKLLLDCNIFLIHVPFPSVIIFLPNSHEFSKANYDTSGFYFFPLMPLPRCCTQQPFKGRLKCFLACL